METCESFAGEYQTALTTNVNEEEGEERAVMVLVVVQSMVTQQALRLAL